MIIPTGDHGEGRQDKKDAYEKALAAFMAMKEFHSEVRQSPGALAISRSTHGERVPGQGQDLSSDNTGTGQKRRVPEDRR
jgi:hypothetical protein